MSITVNTSWSVARGSAVASVQTGAASVNPTTGNTIIVTVSVYALSGSANAHYTVSDTAGNTYVLDASSVNGGNPNNFNQNGMLIFRSTNITGGSNFKITVTVSTGTSYFTVGAIEVVNLAASPVDTASAGDSGHTGHPDTGSWTTTNANDLLVAGFSDDGIGTITSPAGFTSFAQNTAAVSGQQADHVYQIVSAIQSAINPQWSLSNTANDWFGVGVAYKAVAPLGGFPYLLLMGGTQGQAF
jgi:hypothetical protein